MSDEQKHPMYPIHWGGHKEVEFNAEELLKRATDYADELEEENPYCEICNSCGETGCCSTENTILAHGCKYAYYHAKDVCIDQVVLEELYKYVDSLGRKDILEAAYDKAFKLAEEKYGNKS